MTTGMVRVRLMVNHAPMADLRQRKSGDARDVHTDAAPIIGKMQKRQPRAPRPPVA